MPLVERILGLNADGSTPTGNPDRPRITIHEWWAVSSRLVAGNLTVGAIKTYYDMNASEATEFDEMVANAPTGTSTAALIAKLFYVNDQHAVFLLYEAGVTGYASPADIRTQLSLPTP